MQEGCPLFHPARAMAAPQAELLRGACHSFSSPDTSARMFPPCQTS